MSSTSQTDVISMINTYYIIYIKSNDLLVIESLKNNKNSNTKIAKSTEHERVLLIPSTATL